MSPSRSRALALGLSSLISITAAAFFLRWREERRPDLTLVEVDEGDVAAVTERLRGATPSPGGGGLLRFALDEETVRRVMPLKGKLRQYDPFCYFRYVADISQVQRWNEHPDGEFIIATNSLGLRQDGELAPQPPDLRVLVAGDSHMTGVCNNAECFPARLEALLADANPEWSVEVINGSHGAYSFYHYLGVLERMLHLGFRPDLFLVAVYGGNDFLATFFWHLFEGTTNPPHTREELARKKEVSEKYGPAMGQVLNAADYFRRGGPDEVDTALRMGREVTLEIQRLCRAEGIDLVLVYLPAPSEVPERADMENVRAGAEILRLSDEDLALVGTMGELYREDMRAEGLTVIDLTPAFRGLEERLYWHDLHLNLTGHERAAEVVFPWVQEWWERREE